MSEETTIGERVINFIVDNSLFRAKDGGEVVVWSSGAPELLDAFLSEAEKGWRCFHCNTFFTDRLEASKHFGQLNEVPDCAQELARITELYRCRNEALDTANAIIARLREERDKWKIEAKSECGLKCHTQAVADGLRSDLATARKELETERAAVELLRKELAEAREALSCVERLACHHGTKGIWTAEQTLSMIQHYPPIEEITESYSDGKVPETENPYANYAALLTCANTLANRLVATNSVLTALATKHSDVPTDTIEANAAALADFKSKSETK